MEDTGLPGSHPYQSHPRSRAAPPSFASQNGHARGGRQSPPLPSSQSQPKAPPRAHSCHGCSNAQGSTTPLLGIRCTSSWGTPPATSAPRPPSGVILCIRLRFLGSLLGWAHAYHQPEGNPGLPDQSCLHTAAPGQHFGPCDTEPYLPYMHSHTGINICKLASHESSEQRHSWVTGP